MGNFAVLCTDDALNTEIRQINKTITDSFDLTILKTKLSAIQFLNYELPEINILNWSDKVLHMNDIVDEMRKDPWLHYGASIILYHGVNEQEVLKATEGVNLVSLIDTSRLSYYLPRVLGALYSDRSMLTQWNFHTLVRSNLTGTFELERDAFDLITHVHILCNFLYNSNLVGREEKERFYVVMVEQLMKLVESARLSREKIKLEYKITGKESEFIVDVGDPHFRWPVPTLPLNAAQFLKTEEIEGRFCVSISHHKSRVGLIPSFFTDQAEIAFRDQEVVFSQGEDGNHLYYIVAGEFEVLANGRRVSILTPADVFLGEMSFLLKNKRTATVRALGPGRLIRISKQEFIHSLKDKPHYAFFLSRMLAERLVRLHQGKV